MIRAKTISLALVLMMVMGAFGMIMPGASADIISPDNDRNISYEWYPWSQPLDDQDIFVGQEDVTFSIRVWNGNSMDADDLLNANLAIATTVQTVTGGSLPAGTPNPIDEWHPREITGGTIAEGGLRDYIGFQFDVANNAKPGFYRLTVQLTYDTTTTTGIVYTGYVTFEVKNRGTVSDLFLVPGDRDKEVTVIVTSTFMAGSRMQSAYLNITIPDSDFSWYGLATNTASAYRDNINAWGGTGNFLYTISVSKSKPSGTYSGAYVLDYTNDDGVRCRETGTVNFLVGNLAMLTATTTTGTIAQGTVGTTLALRFTNTGTVDLLNVKVAIDPNSGGQGNFFFTVADHWEGSDTVTYGEVALGNIVVGAHAEVSMDVVLDLYIPEGRHKLMFAFTAKYFNTDFHTYRTASGWWDEIGIQHVPHVNMGTAGNILLHPDTSTVEGTFVWITVTDTELDLMITSNVSTTPSVAGRILNYPLKLHVQNMGHIRYSNMVLQIETNTVNSPFINVVSPAATLSEEAPYDLHHELAVVYVNLKPDTALGVYMVPVTVKAVNVDMGEAVSAILNARITIAGIGPRIEVTTVSPEAIKPGQDFTLTLTLTNVGDDTARNVVLNTAMAGDQITTTDGNYAVPKAGALPLYLEDIAPGASITVEIPMKSNSDMSTGHVYAIPFSLYFVDSMGHSTYSGNNIAVSLKSTGSGGSVLGTLYWALVLLVLVIAVFLIIVAIFHVKKNRKPKQAHVQEYHPQPPPQDGMVEP